MDLGGAHRVLILRLRNCLHPRLEVGGYAYSFAVETEAGKLEIGKCPGDRSRDARLESTVRNASASMYPSAAGRLPVISELLDR